MRKQKINLQIPKISQKTIIMLITMSMEKVNPLMKTVIVTWTINNQTTQIMTRSQMMIAKIQTIQAPMETQKIIVTQKETTQRQGLPMTIIKTRTLKKRTQIQGI